MALGAAGRRFHGGARRSVRRRWVGAMELGFGWRRWGGMGCGVVRGVLNRGRRGSWGGAPRGRPARSPAGESFSVGALEKERGRRRGRQAGPAGQRRSARRGLSGTDRWARGAGRERGAGQRAVREAAHYGCQVGQGGSGSTRQAVGEASAKRRVQAGLRHASRAEREGRAG